MSTANSDVEYKHIMLVDDEVEIANLWRDVLEGAGYSVDVFADPLEAFSVLEKGEKAVHLLITDQTMPQMTGHDLARKVSALDPSIGIILMTGFSAVVTEENCRSFGIDKVIVKPIRIHELLNTIIAVFSSCLSRQKDSLS